MKLLSSSSFLFLFASNWILLESDAAEFTCESKEEECLNIEGPTDPIAYDYPIIVKPLIDWVGMNDGYIDDRQKVEFINKKYGVYAKQNIDKDEILLFIPNKLIISNEDVQDTTGYSDLCNTIKAVHQEMEKDLDSDYWPFMFYLRHHLDDIPEMWTKEGIGLFKTLIGNNLPPREIRENFRLKGSSFYQNICEMKDNVASFSTEVAAYVYSKHTFMSMVPFYDLYNHRNGEWLNTNISFNETGFSISARRDIEAGEQIYVSHNMCNLCKKEMDTFLDTPRLLLRHGFVEPLPQRWELGEKLRFDLVQTPEGELDLTWLTNQSKPTYNDVSFLLDELERLDNFPQKLQTHLATRGSVNLDELDIINEYHGALKTAIRKAIESSDPLSDSQEDANVYDMDEKYWRDKMPTCDAEYLDHTNFRYNEQDHFEIHHSHYQKIIFFENLQSRDKCLKLDERLHICSKYRSHYHEPFVHFPVVFMNEIRRVVFVGGGDSMLLHEVLKYNDVEFVVGLELDQQVVRQSFKHFFTQPHFDDDRIEWWFGDASKTINILPEKYFGSFDLVLVDLPETVMSSTISEHLSMLEALTLLVKPDGVFVKNGHYINELKTMFDYTVDIYIDEIPILCDQHFALGSNRINFLEPQFSTLLNYNINNFVYTPLDDIKNHYNLISEYTMNDARSEGKCKTQRGTDDNLSIESNIGVFMAIDAEHNFSTGTIIDSDFIADVLIKAAEEEGLTVISFLSRVLDRDCAIHILVMKEGYIVAHPFDEHSFISIDVQLWAAFHRLDTIKFALQGILQIKKWQSYRIVVGGMNGTDHWENDRKTIGPRVTSARNCDVPKPLKKFVLKRYKSMALEESLNILDQHSSVAVLCDQSKHCQALDTISGFPAVSFVLLPCQNDNGNSPPVFEEKDGTFYLSFCTDEIEYASSYITSTISQIQNIVIDQSAPESLITELIKVLRRSYLRSLLFESEFTLIMPFFNEPDTFRKSAITKIRSSLFKEPSTLVEITVRDAVNHFNIGFFATGSSNLLTDVTYVAESINTQKGIASELSYMKGNVVKFQDDVNAIENSIDDYDRIPAINQYIEQNPLASQSIFQLGIHDTTNIEDDLILNFEDLRKATEVSISSFQILESNAFRNIGNGALIIYILAEGHAIFIWDGRAHVDINILTYNEDIDHKEKIVNPFIGQLPQLKILLHDEQPRGTNRVINFKKDIGGRLPDCVDLFFNCKTLAKDGLCKDNDEKDVMKKICPFSCGHCKDPENE